MHEPESHHRTEDPHNGRQEGKRLCGAISTAESMEANNVPVKGVSALIIQVFDEQTERCEPGEREKDVHGPMEEAAGEGKEPEEREKERDAGDDFDVDEPSEWETAARLVVMKIRADNACNDLRTVSQSVLVRFLRCDLRRQTLALRRAGP